MTPRPTEHRLLDAHKRQCKCVNGANGSTTPFAIDELNMNFSVSFIRQKGLSQQHLRSKVKIIKGRVTHHDRQHIDVLDMPDEVLRKIDVLTEVDVHLFTVSCLKYVEVLAACALTPHR